MKRLAVVLFALAAGACKTASTASSKSAPIKAAVSSPASGPIHLTLVGTNDTHGWIEPRVTRLSNGATFEWGGAAIFGGYLEILRKENPGGVLLLDAGDLFQGTLVSNVTEGRAVIDAFDRLEYTAAAIGNHEFDYGPEGAAVMSTRPDEDPFGAIAARIREAKFPLLSRNIYEAATNQRPAWLINPGWKVIEVKGVKVGLFGLTTPQTPYTTNPANVSTLRFGALVPEALAAATTLREQGAEIVVALTHAGGKCDRITPPNDLSTCDQEHGEVFQMLNHLPVGTIDAVIAGHVHSRLGHFVRGTPVISTPGMGKSFGTIDLWIDPTTHKVGRSELRAEIPLCLHTDATGSCNPADLEFRPPAAAVPARFDGEEVHEDAGMVLLLQPHLEHVRQAQERPVGVEVPKALVRNYEMESPLGDVMVDALREMEHVDIALMNSGGLRADLSAGPLTYGRVYEVMPFDNTVATLKVTGEELRRILEAAYGARKGVYQVSGLKLRLSRCPGPGRLREVRTTAGKPLGALTTYTVAMPDFLARGGDGLGSVVSTLPQERVDLGSTRPLNFRDAMVSYWQQRGKPLIAPKLGTRVTFLEDRKSCSASGH